MNSWSEWDAVRHHMYADIYKALQLHSWPTSRQLVVEIGASEPTTPVLRMMATLQQERMLQLDLVARNYPEVDIQKLCYWNGELDMLVADQVLEHVPKVWEASYEVWRTLRTGGVAVIASPFMFPIHSCPSDYWRMTLDAYGVLFPDRHWRTLTSGQWGSKEIMQWAYNDQKVRGFVGDWVPVNKAIQEVPNFESTITDGQYPVVVWWVGEKL